MEDIELIKNVTLIIGTVIAVFTLLKGYADYKSQTKQKRAEFMLSLRKTHIENPDFKKIRLLLYDFDTKTKEGLGKIPITERVAYADFLENIAILTSSGLISKKVSCHAFSWYAIKCWNTDEFWGTIKRDNFDWGLLKRYVEEMSNRQKKCGQNCNKCKISI